MGDETQETGRVVESRSEQLLDTLDGDDLRSSLLSLRERRRTHLGRAALCAILPLYGLLRMSLLEGGMLAYATPLIAIGVFELWRALSAHLSVRDSARLLQQVEESMGGYLGTPRPTADPPEIGGQSGT